MGQSHFKSNYIGFAGTEYIASVAAIKNVTTISGVTNLTVTNGNITTASVNVLKVVGAADNSYVTIGAGPQYILTGNSNTEASVVLEATALVATPLIGSMYMSRKGQLWFYTSDTQASPVGNMD